MLFLLLMPTAFARAQDKTTVTGVVVDENNLPVVGASVLVKNTVNGVSTGVDGSYSITLDDVGSVLVYSFLGYTPQEVVGRLAFVCGLQNTPAPRAPEDLIDGFRWDKVPQTDICLPEGLF